MDYSALKRLCRALCVLVLTAVALPVVVAAVLPAWAWTYLASETLAKKPPTKSNGRCVLILGGAKGKVLHIARLFKAEGYKVVVAESTMFLSAGASFSRSVDVFTYVPRPDTHPEGYKSKIIEMVKRHDPDLFIPVDANTVQLDIELFSFLPKHCVPLACQADVFGELDNKMTFAAALAKNGIRSPKTVQVVSRQEAFGFLKGRADLYVLKPIVYDSVARADICPPADDKELLAYLENKNITPSTPFVVQERLVGPEMASCSLVLNGRILAHTAGPSVPVLQTHSHTECADIKHWLQEMLERYPKPLAGWLTVDFMKSPTDDKFYPMECNPRLGTTFMLFTQHDGTIPSLQREIDAMKSNETDDQAAAWKKDTPDPKKPDFPTKFRKVNTKNSDIQGEVDDTVVSKSSGFTDGKEEFPEHAQPSSFTESKSEDSSAETSKHNFQPPGTRQLYYLLNVVWVLLSNPSVAVWREYLGIVWRGHEAVFSLEDPWPFLALNFLQIPTLLVRNLLTHTPWNTVDYNIRSLRVA